MTPIAARVLTVDGDPNRTVTIEIYAPEPDPASTFGDWRCEYRLRGALDVQDAGYGVDSLQALGHAIQAARKALDESGLTVTWDGLEPGDHGIPRDIPRIFGLDFTRELEDEVQRRLEAHRPPWAPPPDSPDDT